jgi:hypothetical protein
MDFSWMPDWARKFPSLPDWIKNTSWWPNWIRDTSWLTDWHFEGNEFLASEWTYLLGFLLLMVISIGMYFYFRKAENPLEGPTEEMSKILQYFKPGTKIASFDLVKIRLAREVPCSEDHGDPQS